MIVGLRRELKMCTIFCISVQQHIRKVLDDTNTLLEVWNETGIEHCLVSLDHCILTRIILAPFTDSRLSFQQCQRILSAPLISLKSPADAYDNGVKNVAGSAPGGSVAYW